MGYLHRTAKKILQRILLPRQYELRQISSEYGRGFEGMFRHAKRRGLNPAWVYDVGVGFGTPWLYEAFPHSKHVWFEPLPMHQTSLIPLMKRLNASLRPVALSKQAGTMRLRVPARTTGSSLRRPTEQWLGLNLNRIRGLSEEVFEIDVPTVTLDSLHQGGRGVLKMDVEGAEMDVLEGATKTLADVDLLVMEMSVFPRIIDEPSFARKIAFLDEMGFELADIPALNYPVLGASLGYIDAVFTPKVRPLW